MLDDKELVDLLLQEVNKLGEKNATEGAATSRIKLQPSQAELDALLEKLNLDALPRGVEDDIVIDTVHEASPQIFTPSRDGFRLKKPIEPDGADTEPNRRHSPSRRLSLESSIN